MKFKRLWKVHDLKELGRRVGAPSSILRVCDSLNPHYIQTRYPVEVVYTEEMAERAFEDAKKVVEWAGKRM